ncbi:hypothetical protein PUN28_000125 [Cardiocondyla obscurior]|uniref:Secreted protein n=1 Tax=Cardiocondyla obscurior TaxID=286306 RepID=A0AAW2GY62_9HYME
MTYLIINFLRSAIIRYALLAPVFSSFSFLAVSFDVFQKPTASLLYRSVRVKNSNQHIKASEKNFYRFFSYEITTCHTFKIALSLLKNKRNKSYQPV